MNWKWDPRALEVLHRLEQAGHQAVLVGGCVRDSLLSIPPHDYDAATSAHPEEILAACSGLHCVETGKKHGTITVICDGLSVEVTTFRQESTYSDHRHPDRVEFTNALSDDLARRDFTINAMAWSPSGIVDPFGGQDDLAAGLVRCVGDPDQRFEEDALRLLRGLRLAAQLEFSLHPDTTDAIHCHASDLSHVAWERIAAEFIRLICSPGAESVLLDFPDVVSQILPELKPSMGFEQHNPHHCYDVYTHSVKALAHVPSTPPLRLAALLHDAGKPATFTMDEQGIGHFYGHPKQSVGLAASALDRLRLDRETQEQILALIARHDLPVEASRPWVGRWLSRLGEQLFFDLMALKRADGLACGIPGNECDLIRQQAELLARELLAQTPCLTLKTLAVNGRDALAAGLSGPDIGRALRTLLEQVAEGHLPNDRSVLLLELAHFKP